MNPPGKLPRLSAQAVADAARSLDLAFLQKIISSGVKPNHLANKSVNAITEAVRGERSGDKADEQRRLEIIALLAGAGCPVEHPTLFHAIYYEELQVLRELIARGADVNALAPCEVHFAAMKGESPLNCAVKLGAAGAVRELLAAGADPDRAAGPTYRFGYGVSHRPLWLAVNYDRVEIVQMLVEAGGDVNLRDPELDSTPLEHAVTHGHPECVQLLVDAGANASRLPACDITLVEQSRRNKVAIAKRIEEGMS